MPQNILTATNHPPQGQRRTLRPPIIDPQERSYGLHSVHLVIFVSGNVRTIEARLVRRAFHLGFKGLPVRNQHHIPNSIRRVNLIVTLSVLSFRHRRCPAPKIDKSSIPLPSSDIAATVTSFTIILRFTSYINSNGDLLRAAGL